MATQDYAASIQGVAIRVTRLDAAGKLLNGPGDSYVTNAFMRVSFTPEYEEGDEITEKSANGAIAVTYKSPDTLKRINLELAIVEPDPELNNLLSGGLLLRRNDLAAGGTYAAPVNKSVGWASPGVGDDPAGYGVSIEAWSWAIKDGKKDSTNPYFYWVFPYAKVRQSGDRVIENGIMANTFEGYGLGNVNFGSGPDGRWEFPAAAERPYSYARTTWAPQGLKGFYTWSYTENGALGNAGENPTYNAVTSLDGVNAVVSKASLTSNVVTLTSSTSHNIAVGQALTVAGVDKVWNISKKAISNANVATITTTATHNLVVGDKITIAGVDSILNGNYTTTTGTTGSTIKFAKVASEVAEVDATGTATAKLFNGTFTVASVPSLTTLTYSINSTDYSTGHADIAEYTVAAGAVETVASTSGSTTGFNVPGNVNYNADLPIDRVIRSNEDPTA